MPTAQLYIKRDQEATWASFKKTCKANNWKMSEKIMEYVQKIVDVHGDGGSQTLIDHAGKAKTLPLYKTCRYSSQELVKGVFTCICGGKYVLRPEWCENNNIQQHCYREKLG